MKKIFFTVGPTQIFPTLKKHIFSAIKNDILSISHRSEYFQNLYQQISENLKNLFNIPKNYHIFFLSSSLEAMERIIQNTVYKYSFHFINGAFSEKFYQIAKDLKKSPIKKILKNKEDYNLKKTKIPANVELICLTQNETSNGIAIPIKEIEFLKKIHPNKLIAVDLVSSFPYPKINFEYIDMVFFSVQKCFGMPAGLSILITSDQSIKKAEFLLKKKISIGSYHNFINLKQKESLFQTPETPNIFYLYLFNKILKDFKKISLEKIRKDIEKKAKIIYDYFDDHKILKPAIEEKSLRSQTTIVINTNKLPSEKIISKLKKYGLIVGTGYKENKNHQIRIANFPAHKISWIKKLISTFDRII